MVASAAIWLACRAAGDRRAVVYAIEMVGLVAVCSLYTVMAAGIPQAFRPEMTILLNGLMPGALPAARSPIPARIPESR